MKEDALLLEADPPSLGVSLGCVVPICAVVVFFLNPVLSAIVVLVLVPYFVLDQRAWNRDGIRAIEVDAEGITVLRGPEPRCERIERARITEVDAYRKKARAHLQVMLGGQVTRVPGLVTLYEGPKLHVTDETFKAADFERLVERVRALAPEGARVSAPLPPRPRPGDGEADGGGDDGGD